MILQVVMANPAVGKNPSNKKVLNNSNPDLASIMAHSGHIQVQINNVILYIMLYFLKSNAPFFRSEEVIYSLGDP